LIAFNSFLRYLFGPVDRIVNLNLSIQSALASLERIIEFENLSTRIKDRKGAKPLTVERGKIEFENVVFGYDQASKVLRGINLKIGAGEKVALVGKSGVGKSTIVSLLLRLYEPQEGRILIDDTDTRDATIDSLRRSIGIVSQDTFLFNATIEENLKLAKPDASSEEIKLASDRAGCTEFITKLPDGFQTVVGERGARLSGGQRQRLAIARAFLKDAKILVMDEATSQIDSVSERIMQDSLRQLFAHRSVVIIAHRISTILMCDKIAFLDSGEDLVIGKHEELYSSLDTYRQICHTQMIPSENGSSDPRPSCESGPGGQK
jgi:ABC-type multidrug transport system fused ATPase/permease subunit